MEISRGTIEAIITRGDAATAFDIIRTLLRQIKTKNDELALQARELAKLKSQLGETASERDRLTLVARKLTELCNENGLSDRARAIAQPRPTPPAADGPITIDLE